jgi:hypothetical protein
MLDLAGCSDPYAPARPSDYGDWPSHNSFTLNELGGVACARVASPWLSET